MSDLFWPGDERAGALLSDQALLDAMIMVEDGWLAALVDAGVAPAAASASLTGLVGGDDLPVLAAHAEAGGNPVITLVALLRERCSGETVRWLHRGLTSQDVVDTALALCLQQVSRRVEAEQRRQVEVLTGLAVEHATTPMVGRTLTQPAVPITFGLKAVVWLTGILDAAEILATAQDRLAVQVGGAAGTLAAPVELAVLTDQPDPVRAVDDLVQGLAGRLGLTVRSPWHTVRTPFTAVADALVTCCDAYGHLATDVTTLSRPEIGELSEGAGGGSSTMPHKQNPVLSVLIRRAALTAPGLAATVHLAAATTLDERPDGAWHAEWAALRDLGRRTVVVASQVSDLLTGLRVDSAAMAANLDAADGVDAEQRSLVALVGGVPSASYPGLTEQLITRAVERGHAFLTSTKENEQ